MSYAILISLGIYFLSPLLLTVNAARFSASRGLPTALVFVTATIAQQLLFALYAALFSSYVVALPFAGISTLVLARFIVSSHSDGGDTTTSGRSSSGIVPWLLFATTFTLYLVLRTRYPFIHFYNTADDVGVEKMFNLSLQQSFLFGQSYPPEWVWLAGEPIRYYAFLKSIPGVWAWIARVVCGDPATGGVFFLLSEAFFISLIPLVVSGWICYFGRRYVETSRHWLGVNALAIITALFVLVGTHTRALLMGLDAVLGRSSGVDWWALTRLLPGTDNQYIGWLLMLGDNHAYSQVYFLQLLFWGFFVKLLVTPTRAVYLSVIVGMIAAAVLVSHPGSVLIDVSSLGIAVAIIAAIAIIKRDCVFLRIRLLHALTVALTASVFLLPIYEPAGSVKFVFPETRLLSPAWEFLQLQFSVLLFLGLISLLFVPARLYGARFIQHAPKLEWLWVAVIIFATTAYLLERPALSIMVVLSAFVYAYFSDKENILSEQSLISLVAASSFWIWLIPEIVAFDHTIDNRTDWIRFQLSLRFWPEGFLLIPFSLALCSLSAVPYKKSFGSFIGVGVLSVGLFGISHKPGIENRATRASQQASFDGFAGLTTTFPADSRIVSFLRNLPASPKVVIAEACGVGRPSIPVEFNWAGRIAAFSGRVGVCGWARHAMLYNNPLRQPEFEGLAVEQKLASYEEAYVRLMESVQSRDGEAIAEYAAILKGFGVTHIVFGMQEKRLFQQLSIEAIAAALGVPVLFAGGDGTGVLLIAGA